MKKEKILSFTLYVFCILALFYAAVMLFQTNTQIATYNMSSYVPMTLGEKIQFLFSNTYVPFFFAIITYALGNIVDMLHAINNPEEVTAKSVEKADVQEKAAEEVTEKTSQEDVAAQEETDQPDQTVPEESDEKTADQTEEPGETESAEDTALESEPEEDKPEETETAKDLAEEAKPADDPVTEEADTITDQE